MEDKNVQTEIIVALIGSGATLLGVMFQNYFHNKNISNLIEYRITQLEKKQDKHNQLIDRMYAVEKTTALLKEQIDDVEEKVDARKTNS